MIKDLQHKAKQEKYHNSIINFAHLLKGEQREVFIDAVSKYNLLLAAKCIMSAEANLDLENKLKNKSTRHAKLFSNTEISSQGFLTLVELEEFNTAFDILKSIKQANKIHREILSKIFQNTSLSITLDFLINFLKGNRTNLWNFAINEIVISEKLNKATFKKIQIITQYLFDNKLYFLLIPLLDKVDINPSKLLQKDIHLIIDEFKVISKSYIIEYILKLTDKYEVEGYSNPNLINLLIEIRTSDSIKTAIELINEYEVEGYSNTDLINLLIEIGTSNSIKTAIKLINKCEIEGYSTSKLVKKL
ncbi:MAG: hypothetical protein AB8G11_19685, partial [Saprospiraceae bacterium]